MADSKNTTDNFIGKYGIYVIKRKIGKGGNGQVYEVEIENKAAGIPKATGYALKLLMLNPNMKDDEKRRREERFKREIETVSTKLVYLKGIIPIFDSSYANGENDYQYQWYLMPKAEPFLYKNYSIEDRVSYMMQVAETISVIHKMNLSHRDIKPDNILMYNEHLCLTDFGLIWSEDFDTQITDTNESIGPIAIRPPELNAPVNQSISMFLKSDVYLFAKTLWIVLTGRKKGFYKRYSRIDNDVYLKSLIKTSYTLEPIHELMENSTYDNYLDRMSIDECRNLLITQRNVFQYTLPESDLASLKYKEAYAHAEKSVKPDEVIVFDDGKKQALLNDMCMNSKIIISEFGKEIELGVFYSINHVEHDVFKIEMRDVFGSRNSNAKCFFVKISSIHLKDNNVCIAYTEYIEYLNDYGIICRELKRLPQINAEKVCIDGKFELRIVP